MRSDTEDGNMTGLWFRTCPEASLAGTILVVDDNRDAVDVIATLLQACGYTVAKACSAKHEHGMRASPN
jgi:PleD family two-component response regulator